MQEVLRLQNEHAGFKLTLNAFRLGPDLLVVIEGGASHAGAVALGVNYRAGEANASVLAAPGHKEDAPTHRCAYRISKALGCRVAVVMGIHFPDLRKEQIAEIEKQLDMMTQEAIKKLKGRNKS